MWEDLQITNRLFYQLSYVGLWFDRFSFIKSPPHRPETANAERRLWATLGSRGRNVGLNSGREERTENRNQPSRATSCAGSPCARSCRRSCIAGTLCAHFAHRLPC